MSQNDNATDGSERIETEVVDPDAPVRYVRLVVNGDEAALIPWEEAEAVRDAVDNYDTGVSQDE